MALVSKVPTRFWCDEGVPFEVGDDILIDSGAQPIVSQAIDQWNSTTNLRLFARIDTIHSDFVVFTKHPDSCSSPVGRQGGAQIIGCPIGGAGFFDTASILHEIGHAVGLHHEHCRSDRDSFITIDFDNIQPDEKHNFCPDGSPGRNFGEYDYASIMHYGRRSGFAIDQSKDVITPTDPTAVIGSAQRLSQGDVAAINGLCPTVPLVRELSVGVAVGLLTGAGFGFKLIGLEGPNTFVSDQSPFGGVRVGFGTIVKLTLRDGPIP